MDRPDQKSEKSIRVGSKLSIKDNIKTLKYNHASVSMHVRKKLLNLLTTDYNLSAHTIYSSNKYS